MLRHMAGKALSSEKLVSFPRSEEAESLLAFQFDQEGKPRVIAEFVSDRDKFAILCFAQTIIAEFVRETGRGALASLRRTDAA